MLYRVVCKKLLASSNQLAVVEDVIEADDFVVNEGVLVFCRRSIDDADYRSYVNTVAIPAGLWLSVELHLAEQPSLVTP